jgi:hypothetical protein
MEGGGIKVGSVGPDQRVNFPIKPDLIKELEVLQGTIEMPREDWLEVNYLLGVIVKLYAKHIGTRDWKIGDSVDWVLHGLRSFFISMGLWVAGDSPSGAAPNPAGAPADAVPPRPLRAVAAF